MIKLYFKILNSPFVRPKFMVYIGRIKHGHPYFLPRRWVMTSKGFRSPKPINWLGFDYNGLGWKTKFESYRFEYVPSFSIVFLGIQFYIAYKYNPTNSNEPIAGESYWEGVINYLYNTEESKNIEGRTDELFNNYSCSWRSFKNGGYVTIDYYPLILKKKYRKIYEDKLINDKLSDMSSIDLGGK